MEKKLFEIINAENEKLIKIQKEIQEETDKEMFTPLDNLTYVNKNIEADDKNWTWSMKRDSNLPLIIGTGGEFEKSFEGNNLFFSPEIEKALQEHWDDKYIEDDDSILNDKTKFIILDKSEDKNINNDIN